MATLTVYSDAADGEVYWHDATYSNARSGSGTSQVLDGTNNFSPGQFESGGEFWCGQAFVSFDTSPLGAGATVSGAVLSLYDNSDFVADNAFTMEARLQDWGTSVADSDFVAGGSLSGLTLLGSKTSASRSAAAYNDFSDTAMAANVNKTGSTRMIVCSSRQTGNNAPSSGQFEYWSFFSAGQAGTTNDPKLVITYTLPGQPTSKRFGGVPFMGAHGSGLQAPVRQWIRRASGLLTPQFATTQIWRPV